MVTLRPFFDDWLTEIIFGKLSGGIFITIGMTGLDQDMMQKFKL